MSACKVSANNKPHLNLWPSPDAVKRRTLPAWIREGLEKRDRENQKKLERERMEKERAEMSKDDDKAHEVDEGGDGPRVPRRSKFVSRHFFPSDILLSNKCFDFFFCMNVDERS